jgi:hypothetical protein
LGQFISDLECATGHEGTHYPSHPRADRPFPPHSTVTGLESVLPNLSLEALKQFEESSPILVNPPIAQSDMWTTGVACADNGGIYSGKKPGDFIDSIRKFENESWLGGELQVVNKLFCSGWKITTVERYVGKFLLIFLSRCQLLMWAGPFGGKTKNPILLGSNTLDPITFIDKYILYIISSKPSSSF